MGLSGGGFTSIPNKIMDALIITDLTASEQKIIRFIIRFSYGIYQQKAVTLQQWNDLCVCGINKTNIKRMLSGLETKKILKINWATKTISIQDDTTQWVGWTDMTNKINDILYHQLKNKQNSGVVSDTTDSCMATNSDSCMATNSHSCEATGDAILGDSKESSLNKEIKKEQYNINSIYIKEKSNLINVVRNVLCSTEGFTDVKLQIWNSYVDEIEKYNESEIQNVVVLLKELVDKGRFNGNRIESGLKFIGNTIGKYNKQLKQQETERIIALADKSTIKDYDEKRYKIYSLANSKWNRNAIIPTPKEAGDLVKIFPEPALEEWETIFSELGKKPANWQDLKEDVQNILDKKGKI